ncbi:AAA family ATPase [Streptomyces sp. NPDC047108]|uniref:ATP-binding protein n=1 Tax=Streptomyces sp. NPDC047108 TaxID=3155025 RepID=UPI00340AD5CB
MAALPLSGGTLLGRAAEAAELRSFLQAPEGDGPILFVTGEPGIGKSALIDAEVARVAARSTRVLRAEGSENESDLAFAGLHQILRPVLAHVQRLPERQRDAILSAFGMAAGAAAPDQLILRIAVLTLLSELADDDPLLIVVDDGQWIDRDSWEVLSFVARRLHRESIALLVAQRSGAPLPPLGRNAPVVPLRPLDTVAAHRLLDAQPRRPAGQRRVRILEEAAGNPLALIEFAGTDLPQTPGQPLPLTERLERGFAVKWHALPEGTRSALLLAATDMAPVEGAPPEVWFPAEQAGLVRVQDGDVRFRHPLIRSAVHDAATPAERHEAHRTWAETLRDVPERRAWHLAAAGSGPDEDVARELERAAEETRRRGAFTSAAQAFQRAAELSPEHGDRARRYTLAAAMAALTGQVSWVEELTAEVHTLTEDPVLLALATLRTGQALALTPRRSTAYAPLLRTAKALAPHSPHQALEALATAALICYYCGDTAQREALRRVFRSVVEEHGHQPPGLGALWIRTAADPLDDRAALLADLHDLLADESHEPGFLAATATLAWLLDETGLAVGLFEEARSPVLTTAALPDGLRCVEGWTYLEHGQWARARAVADASRRAAAESDPPYEAAAPLALDASVLALRGDSAGAHASAMQALASAASDDNGFVTVRARWAMGMAATADGDHEAAFAHFRTMFTADGGAVHYHVSPYGLADLAASAVRVGRRDSAAVLVEGLAGRLESASPRQRALLFRARALLADTAGTERHFRAALAVPSSRDRPFAHAQTQLEYGEWLRRQLRSSSARPLLTASLETFRRLGAGPWATRALGELRAAGVREAGGPHEGDGSTDGLPDLTPQQEQIVHLAAIGLTNRQIGERLQLSPRTVGSHLYRSFPKLGVTARSQLRDVIEEKSRTGTAHPHLRGTTGHPRGVATA